MDGVLVTDTYHPSAGFVFLFNLIVGTGALTMPKAFASAGWILSLVIVVLLCFVSFVTVTFVIESMSIANYYVKTKRFSKREASDNDVTAEGDVDDDDEVQNTNETSCLLSPLDDESPDDGSDRRPLHLYDITHRVELGTMARGFLPRAAVRFFYVAICIYLYGDLVIYSAAISKSLRDITCTYQSVCNVSQTLLDSDECWLISGTVISRGSAYRIFGATLLVTLVPFAYLDVSKTKYMQILTSLFRWGSFTTMIVLAGVALGQGKGRGKPNKFVISGLPNLFGVCVYSFMCHHSLPTLITPISRKGNIYRLIFANYLLILAFYLLLSFTGTYTFADLQDIYTLNFQEDRCSAEKEQIIPPIPFLQYFLPLFPVVTLGTSFPIIAITLTYNLKTLLMPCILRRMGAAEPSAESEHFPLTSSTSSSESGSSSKRFYVERLFFPSLAAIPPVFLAMVTDDLQILVGIVGSYAGTCIQYVIPALLIIFARKQQSFLFEDLPQHELQVKESLTSPFRHKVWVYFVLLWAVVCMVFVTIDHIIG